MENDNHEEYGNPRNTGRRGLQGEAKTKSLLWPHSIGIGGATLLKYKKGLKRPTLAWNEIPFVTHRTRITPDKHGESRPGMKSSSPSPDVVVTKLLQPFS